ncbi:MAG: non-canonical purine NTP pyrophosphatase, partial [bacterium]
MKAVVASHNAGKLAELRALFRGSPLELAPPPDAWTAPEETGATYADNARLKARSLAVIAGGWALADDSGLETDALGGAPGVRSARFAGEDASDAENIQALLTALAGVPDRRARFRCILA